MESFEELQRPPRALKILLLVVMCVPTLIVAGLALVVSIGGDQPYDWRSAFAFMVPLSMIVLFIVMLTSRLRLRIDQYGVAIRFRPFHLQDKVIRPHEITSWRVRPLNAFWEFGGWGIRWGWKKKWGYVWDGKHAVELTLKNGKTIVCSVVDHTGAAAALHQWFPLTPPTTST